MKRVLTTTLIGLTFLFVGARAVWAQGNPAANTLTEEQKKQLEENEKRAFSLLEQTANEAQFLRLADNRIRVQLGVADLLWSSNQERARSLFSNAADGVAELLRTSSMEQSENRRGPNPQRIATQLRRELVLAAARHDAQLAYQFLAMTRPATRVAATTDTRDARRVELEEADLEQSLLSRVAALDPKFALQNAEQMLDKGELSRSLAEVLRQLQRDDKDAALKLEDKITKKLQSTNLLSNDSAGALALSLLATGPRIGEITLATSGSAPLLAQSTYQDLLATLVDAALKANAQPATNRRPNSPRGRNQGQGTVPQSTQAGPTDAQIEQANARRLLGGLRTLMPLVDQYLPSRAAAVRQKMTEVGLDGGRRGFPSQSASGPQPTSESLVALAASAPPAMQSGIYNRAALRALDEGNLDRARQIANDHLDSNIRESMLKRIESRQLADKTEAAKVEDVRLTLSQLPSDSERVTLLLRLSETAQKTNPELAIGLLEQAREYTNKRATGYPQFEQQLRVSAAFAALESPQGFEVLEPGIMQLNELLAAASVLSGFETNVFREGEMPIQGGGNLSDMVRSFGQQIGSLARIDFERAQSLAGRFQFAESRVVARLAMARTLLRSDSNVNQGARGFRTFNQNPNRQE